MKAYGQFLSCTVAIILLLQLAPAFGAPVEVTLGPYQYEVSYEYEYFYVDENLNTVKLELNPSSKESQSVLEVTNPLKGEATQKSGIESLDSQNEEGPIEFIEDEETGEEVEKRGAAYAESTTNLPDSKQQDKDSVNLNPAGNDEKSVTTNQNSASYDEKSVTANQNSAINDEKLVTAN